MFAVIKTGGKQYRVAAEDVLKIDRIAGEVGDIVQLGEVLAHGEGDKVSIGAPLVDGASVAVEVVEQGRGPKVIAFKKRRRQNSRRKRGHRQLLTTVRISEILLDGAKPSKKAAAKPAPKKKAKDEAAETKGADTESKATEAKSEAKAAPKKADKKAGDDLTAIKGIGPKAAEQLAEQGIGSYADMAKLTDKKIGELAEAIPFSAEQITEWRDQAKELK
ncbi:50S ribosomal protein L21 [Chelativorans sp. ZYF759]|uniref:50S ribosomal protein L21 n=1 Tax=Chelativorans sp. ZYF759 TaxID=2692213 RepID=UPI00145E9009|nr:50S ribosomal protein L21 [Chelativorans sp. ZYF759]NMG41553.1 50S ribosomal protein L21 [Chelativorans sp. ZYF759]